MQPTFHHLPHAAEQPGGIPHTAASNQTLQLPPGAQISTAVGPDGRQVIIITDPNQPQPQPSVTPPSQSPRAPMTPVQILSQQPSGSPTVGDKPFITQLQPQQQQPQPQVVQVIQAAGPQPTITAVGHAGQSILRPPSIPVHQHPNPQPQPQPQQHKGTTAKAHLTIHGDVAFADGDDTNLIVNYVPAEFTDADLEALFAHVGPIRGARVIKDSQGGAKGYGFVRFTELDGAVRALETMTGYAVRNKRLKVNIARPTGRVVMRQGKVVDLGTVPPRADEAATAAAEPSMDMLKEQQVMHKPNGNGSRRGSRRGLSRSTSVGDSMEGLTLVQTPDTCSPQSRSPQAPRSPRRDVPSAESA